MTEQLSMLFEPVNVTDQVALKRQLERGWRTRKELSRALNWPERKIRDVAESLGAQVVRGQRGFNLTRNISREDLPDALQAADAFISQGKRMLRYGFQLKRKLHGVVG